MGVIAGC